MSIKTTIVTLAMAFGLLVTPWTHAKLGVLPKKIAPADPTPTATQTAIINEINDELTDEDANTRNEGIEDIRKLFETDPIVASTGFRSTWLKVLNEAGRNDVVAELAQRAIVATPADPITVEYLLSVRIRALRNLGSTNDALADAKSLYNTATMANTANAMLLLAECLNAAHPEDYTFTARFKAEQMTGARPPATQPSTAPATAPDQPTVLSTIKVNGKAYEAAAKKIFGEDFTSLMSKGNLLLLADRPREAMVIFERAYGVAIDYQIRVATEAIARSMKAEDGAVGRANAWVLSIRPASTVGK